MFIKYLADILEREDKHFRKNTIIFWDGASYHSSKEMKKTLRALDLPIL
jgi:hypothetical protein